MAHESCLSQNDCGKTLFLVFTESSTPFLIAPLGVWFSLPLGGGSYSLCSVVCRVLEGSVPGTPEPWVCRFLMEGILFCSNVLPKSTRITSQIANWKSFFSSWLGLYSGIWWPKCNHECLGHRVSKAKTSVGLWLGSCSKVLCHLEKLR